MIEFVAKHFTRRLLSFQQAISSLMPIMIHYLHVPANLSYLLSQSQSLLQRLLPASQLPSQSQSLK